MLPFTEPTSVASEAEVLQVLAERGGYSSPGIYHHRATERLLGLTGAAGLVLCPSGSSALELAMLAAGIGVGDQVITSAYTYYSSANAPLLRGAELTLIDIDPKTFVMDLDMLSAAITERTKAVIVVHYGGVSPDMRRLTELCDAHGVLLIEDTAQSFMGCYENRLLGTFGRYGCLSFHGTKNITSGGQGGALLVRERGDLERVNLIREHGTDRLEYLAGNVERYSWKMLGSSFDMSEPQCAILSCQLEELELIQHRRASIWETYRKRLTPLAGAGVFTLQHIPPFNTHNSHLFALLFDTASLASDFLSFSRDQGITCATHYLPLDTTEYGKRACRTICPCSSSHYVAERLVRLPLFTSMSKEQVSRVCQIVESFHARLCR